MSIATELQNYETYLTNAWQKVEDKGGTIPQNKNLQNLTSAINTIEGKNIIPPEAGTLTGISFQSLPNKLTYNEGETMDLTGCVVLGSYSSGNTYEVTNNCTYTINDPLLYTDTQVVVTLDIFTLYIPIVVNGVPVEAPSTVYSLYHFESSLYDEVSKTTATGTYREVIGRFENGFGNTSPTQAPVLKLRFPINTSSYFITNPVTLEWWARSNSTPSTPPLTQFNFSVSHMYSGDSRQTIADFSLQSNVATSKMDLYSGTGGWTNGGTVLNYVPQGIDFSEYHHFAIVFNGFGKYRTFLDGLPMCEGNLKYASSTPSGYFQFGSGTRIDELMTCNEMKYWDRFTPNHAPYYIPENNT